MSILHIFSKLYFASYHSCALFENGRAICWGARGANSGQLGTVYTVDRSVSSCGSTTCTPVSSIGFISFSDNLVAITEISAGALHTCGIYINIFQIEVI